MGVETNYLEVMSLKWFLNIHISGVPIHFTPPQISIHIKESVTPTGLEPVIFTVKGWCPNQLDDGAIKISVVIGAWSPHWFVNPIKISYHIGVQYSPGSLMDKHQKVTVTPTRLFLIQPTLCFTPDSNTIIQEHSVFTHTLFPHPVDKLHYNLAGWAQH